MTKFLKKYTALFTYIFILKLFSFSAIAAPSVGPTCAIIPLLTELFINLHVSVHSKSDEINQRATEQFIKIIDPSKNLLLKSDVDSIKPKILSFYQNISRPECASIEAIKPLLVQRQKEQLEYVKKTLNAKDYKLDENAELQLDPDKRSQAVNLEDSQKRLLAQIHFQISNYLLNGTKLPKAKELLIHRYELNVKRLEEKTNSDFYDFSVNAFATSLDPHSMYFSPDPAEDFQQNMRLSLEGIGASLSNDDGYTVIQELLPGGSAAKSKLLQPKDKIISVGQDGKPMENVIDMDLKDVVKLIKGKAGTKVHLTILRETPSIQRITITLVRSKVQLEEEAAKSEIIEKKIDGKTYKLARIELPGFYGAQRREDRSCYVDMLKEIEKVRKAGAKGILLDLSTNGGGLLDEAVRIAGLFINRGNIVATKNAAGEVEMLDDIDNKVQFDGPLVVLTSRFSASASEIVAGALQDYKRAIIVGGDHTFGKGTVQAVRQLQNEIGMVKVTTGIFYIPGGNSTQHRGVSSDISFPSPYNLDDSGEKHLDYSLKPDAIAPFLSAEANATKSWTPVTSNEIEKLKSLSQARVSKSKEFAEILKDIEEMNQKKDSIKLSEIRKKEQANNKKNKDKSAKLIAKERNKPITDEAMNILADYVQIRNAEELASAKSHASASK